VQLRVVESSIIIESASRPRAGWADAAAVVREKGDDGLLDEPIPTEFDEDEWVW